MVDYTLANYLPTSGFDKGRCCESVGDSRNLTDGCWQQSDLTVQPRRDGALLVDCGRVVPWVLVDCWNLHRISGPLADFGVP